MEIRELIAQLEELAESYGDDVEVRIASQPSWPFENALTGVVAADLNSDGEDRSEEWYRGDDETEDEYFDRLQELRESGADEDVQTVVYLEEGSQLGYLPTIAKEELGW